MNHSSTTLTLSFFVCLAMKEVFNLQFLPIYVFLSFSETQQRGQELTQTQNEEESMQTYGDDKALYNIAACYGCGCALVLGDRKQHLTLM